MRLMLWGVAAVALVAVGPATAGEVEFKPIDTKKLVIQPSKIAAGLAAGTIDMVGKTAASGIEKDGFVKTINNVFGFRREVASPTQPGRSGIPTPSMFSSTQYKNSLQPVMPSSMPARRYMSSACAFRAAATTFASQSGSSGWNGNVTPRELLTIAPSPSAR